MQSMDRVNTQIVVLYCVKETGRLSRSTTETTFMVEERNPVFFQS